MPADILWTPRNRKPTWLPGGYGKRLKTRPRTEKDFLLLELEQLGYFMPGAEDEEASYLRDVVARCRSQKRRQDEADERAGREITDRMPPAQIRGMVREFVEWRRRREIAEGKRPKAGVLS